MRAALTRDQIIEAAWELLRSDGLQAVSLRRVAGTLGVTAPALYAHIDGKEDLLSAIADREFDELDERTEPGSTDPVEAIKAATHAYVDYATERPNAFQLLFRYHVDLTTGEPVRAEHPRATEMFERVLSPVQRAIDSGVFRSGLDATTVSLTIWTTAHGLATALHLGYAADDRNGLVGEVIANVVDGFRA